MRNTLRFRNTLLSLNGRRFPNLTPRGASLAFSFIIGTYIAFSLSWAHLGISGGHIADMGSPISGRARRFDEWKCNIAAHCKWNRYAWATACFAPRELFWRGPYGS